MHALWLIIMSKKRKRNTARRWMELAVKALDNALLCRGMFVPIISAEIEEVLRNLLAHGLRRLARMKAINRLFNSLVKGKCILVHVKVLDIDREPAKHTDFDVSCSVPVTTRPLLSTTGQLTSEE